MKHFISMFNLNHWKITGFYPYTSYVIQPVLTQNHNYKTEEHEFLNNIGAQIQQLAEEKGCQWDNKVVVELTYTFPKVVAPAKMYVGCYDGRWSIGFGVHQDEWLERDKRNKHFD